MGSDGLGRLRDTAALEAGIVRSIVASPLRRTALFVSGLLALTLLPAFLLASPAGAEEPAWTGTVKVTWHVQEEGGFQTSVTTYTLAPGSTDTDQTTWTATYDQEWQGGSDSCPESKSRHGSGQGDGLGLRVLYVQQGTDPAGNKAPGYAISILGGVQMFPTTLVYKDCNGTTVSNPDYRTEPLASAIIPAPQENQTVLNGSTSWSGFGTTTVEYHLSIVVPDGDNDGVSDALDKCPHTLPGLAVDERGCWTETFGYGKKSLQWSYKCTSERRFRVMSASVRYYALAANALDVRNATSGVKLKYRVVPRGKDTTFSWDRNWSDTAKLRWPLRDASRGRIEAGRLGQTNGTEVGPWSIEAKITFIRAGKNWSETKKFKINTPDCSKWKPSRV